MIKKQQDFQDCLDTWDKGTHDEEGMAEDM
jgi:hypothetical protein